MNLVMENISPKDVEKYNIDRLKKIYPKNAFYQWLIDKEADIYLLRIESVGQIDFPDFGTTYFLFHSNNAFVEMAIKTTKVSSVYQIYT